MTQEQQFLVMCLWSGAGSNPGFSGRPALPPFLLSRTVARYISHSFSTVVEERGERRGEESRVGIEASASNRGEAGGVFM